MRVAAVLLLAGCKIGFDAPISDASPPVSDAASVDAAADTDAMTVSSNDSCDGATALVIGDVATNDTTCNADDSVTAACSSGSSDVFYRVDVPALSSVTLSLTAGFSALASTSACASFAATLCASNGDQLANPTAAPQTWLLAVQRSGGGCGGFNLRVF